MEGSVTRLEATVAIAALTCCPKYGFDTGPAMPVFFRLALTTLVAKSLLPNFPHNPLAGTRCSKLHAPVYLTVLRSRVADCDLSLVTRAYPHLIIFGVSSASLVQGTPQSFSNQRRFDMALFP